MASTSCATQVPPGSPAEEAGLRPCYRDDTGAIVLGDIIVGFDGTTVKRTEDLLGALDTKRVGDTVKLKVVRGDKEVDVPVKLGKRRVGQGSE